VEALPILEIDTFDEAQLARSSSIVKKVSDQKLTLADAHAFVIMLERRIKSCWSTDRHLGITGVRRVH